MNITVLDMDTIGADLDLSPLTSLGNCVIYPNTAADALPERLRDAEVVILNKIKLTAAILAGAPKLRLICVAATGFDNIDLAYCRAHGIGVANVPGYSTDSVAMVTVSLVLALAGKLGAFTQFVDSGDYTRSGSPNRLTPAFHDLSGKTWGILGYGNIGKKVALVARAFGCKVIYNRQTPSDDPDYRTVDALCAESDILTLHCPLNAKTRGLIDSRRLGLMKKDAILVNVARGAVCDETALAKAIQAGRLGGLGCDVYSAEPFGPAHPYNDILGLPNVLLTPHIAWASFEARTRVVQEMAENIRAFSQGRLRNRVER